MSYPCLKADKQISGQSGTLDYTKYQNGISFNKLLQNDKTILEKLAEMMQNGQFIARLQAEHIIPTGVFQKISKLVCDRFKTKIN